MKFLEQKIAYTFSTQDPLVLRRDNPEGLVAALIVDESKILKDGYTEPLLFYSNVKGAGRILLGQAHTDALENNVRASLVRTWEGVNNANYGERGFDLLTGVPVIAKKSEGTRGILQFWAQSIENLETLPKIDTDTHHTLDAPLGTIDTVFKRLDQPNDIEPVLTWLAKKLSDYTVNIGGWDRHSQEYTNLIDAKGHPYAIGRSFRGALEIEPALMTEDPVTGAPIKRKGTIKDIQAEKSLISSFTVTSNPDLIARMKKDAGETQRFSVPGTPNTEMHVKEF